MARQHYKTGTFRAQISLGYLLRRANSLLLDQLEPLLEARGLSFIQYIVLMSLRDGIAVNPKDICRQVRHDSGALTRVIDQLAERGFVERVRRDRDRRKVELALTPQGRRAVEGVIPDVVCGLNTVLGDFSSDEVVELKRLLGKLITRLESLDGQAPASTATSVGQQA
jgi:DNA-binding MarR family transcriptional regulator